jgi:hypothetical protein
VLRILVILGLILLQLPDGLIPLDCPEYKLLPKEYAEAECSARKAMHSGRYRDAVRDYEAALSIELFEVPNVALYGELGLARCFAGETERGLELLEDHQCMLAVSAEELPCYTEELPDPEHRNRELTERCFEAMCSEMYLSYYDNPSSETIAHIREEQQKLLRMRETCKLLSNDKRE